MIRKHIPVFFASLLVLALVSSLPVACGGDDENPTPTSVPLTTCKPAEAVVPTTPTDLPAGMAEYQSPERGYSVRYPSDWKVQPNTIAVQNIAGDAFFTTAPVGAVKPNFSVSCAIVTVGTTSQEFLEANLDVIEKLSGNRPEIEKTLDIDGKQASVITYSVRQERTPEPLNIEKVEVFFADALGGWDIALVVPKGQLETYRPLFDAFVQSFRGA